MNSYKKKLKQSADESMVQAKRQVTEGKVVLDSSFESSFQSRLKRMQNKLIISLSKQQFQKRQLQRLSQQGQNILKRFVQIDTPEIRQLQNSIEQIALNYRTFETIFLRLRDELAALRSRQALIKKEIQSSKHLCLDSKKQSLELILKLRLSQFPSFKEETSGKTDLQKSAFFPTHPQQSMTNQSSSLLSLKSRKIPFFNTFKHRNKSIKTMQLKEQKQQNSIVGICRSIQTKKQKAESLSLLLRILEQRKRRYGAFNFGQISWKQATNNLKAFKRLIFDDSNLAIVVQTIRERIDKVKYLLPQL